MKGPLLAWPSVGGGCFELTHMYWWLRFGARNIWARPRGTEREWGLWYSALATRPPLSLNTQHLLRHWVGVAGTQCVGRGVPAK